jgi:hypothetical protein
MSGVTPLKLTAPDFQDFQSGDFVPFNFGGTGFTSYTDGQLLIGNSSSGALSRSTLTAGTNITIANGHGTISISASGSGGSSSWAMDTYTRSTLGF